MIVPNINTLNNSNIKEVSIKKHYPDFYEHLITNFPNDLTFGERLYWYFNNINAYPICPICGKRLKLYNALKGYHTYCCSKCSNSCIEKQQKTKSTNLKKYGSIAPAGNKDVRDKMKSTCLKRYGVENISQSKERYEQNIKTRIEKYGGCGNASKISREKYEQTNLERYGVKNPMSSKEFRDSHSIVSPFKRNDVQKKIIKNTVEKYGGIYSEDLKGPTSCPEVLEHIYRIKKENNTFNTSNIEKLFEDYLLYRNIKYDKQYKSSSYPFNCDFYIVDQDIYVELQYSWTHGGHPYDELKDKNILHVWNEKAKKSKYYQNAIKTWTIRDVEKRNIAKQNNLKYLEIFTNNIEEAITEYEKFTNSIRL